MSQASLPPQRFAGDGFDYRRPVIAPSTRHQASQSSTPMPNVIDLTNDSDIPPPQARTRRTSVDRPTTRRQPSARRFHDVPGQRERDVRLGIDTQSARVPVIELDSLNSETVAPPPDAREPLMMNNEDFLALFQEPPSSPGFEITGERSVRPEAPGRSVAERRPTPYVTEEERDHSGAPPLPPPLFRGLPHGLASWIAQAQSRISGRDTAGRAERNVPPEGLRFNGYTYVNGVYAPVPQYSPGGDWQPQPQVQLPRIPALDAFQRPRLNYEAQGFELIGAVRSSPPPRPSSPYKAPRAPATEFTRKVEEDEIVVCPHCGDELGTGCDDLKQQIWVVKQCGHVCILWSMLSRIQVNNPQVYCGECAMNRHVGKNKKMAPQAEGKPEPFKICVVSDCKKPVTSKTALFQVYL